MILSFFLFGSLPFSLCISLSLYISLVIVSAARWTYHHRIHFPAHYHTSRNLLIQTANSTHSAEDLTSRGISIASRDQQSAIYMYVEALKRKPDFFPARFARYALHINYLQLHDPDYREYMFDDLDTEVKVDCLAFLNRQQTQQQDCPSAEGIFLVGLWHAVVLSNKKDAFGFYTRAAAMQHVPASLEMAKCLIEGEVVPQDSTKAIEMMRALAERGLSRAQSMLAEWYERGEDGLEEDYT